MSKCDDFLSIEGLGRSRIKSELLSQIGYKEFLIVTAVKGYYRGQLIRFRALSTKERDLWQESIFLIMQWNPKKEIQVMSDLRRFQKQCRHIYESNFSQLFTASLIGASFVITMSETQIQPSDDTQAGAVFNSIGDFFVWTLLEFDYFLNF